MRYQFGDLRVDTTVQEVRRCGRPLEVNGLTFKFLAFMLKKGDAVATFDELVKGVWKPAVVEEETITQRVRLLRRALGDDRRKPRYIRSVRGQGYQLVPIPRELPDEAAVGQSMATDRKRPAALAAAVAILVLAMASGLILRASDNFDNSSSSANMAAKFLQRADYYAAIGQEDDNGHAIELYQRALGEEPENAIARIGLSLSYSRSVCRFNAPAAVAIQAESIAREVLLAEPDNARAHHALGYSQDCRGHVGAAIVSYSRATELDTGGGLRSMSALAYSLGETGRLAEALSMNLAVREGDPRQTFTLVQLARVYELLGLDSIAGELYAESFELYPDNIFSNVAYPRHLFNQRRFGAARRALEIAKKRPAHPDLLVLSAELSLMNDEPDSARSDFARALEMRPSSSYLDTLVRLRNETLEPAQWAPARLEQLRIESDAGAPDCLIEVALLHQALGQRQQGLRALSAAVAAGYRNADYLRVTPLLLELRTDPAFVGIVEDIDAAVQRQLETIRTSGLPTTLVALR